MTLSTLPTYAVVFKTYAWDAFIERQFSRYAEVVGPGDLFVSVDETNGSVGPIPHDHVDRTSSAALVAMGLANRFEKGSLIWWNPDYPQHQFYRNHPRYDYYVFVEYDSLIRRPIAELIARVKEVRADFVAMPIAGPIKNWFWSLYHWKTYSEAEMAGSLNCISVYSNRAMRLLLDRRLEMSRQSDVPYWPISEVFVASEIRRAGYIFAPLADFGDDGGYDWFPPILEDEIAGLRNQVFLHPVLDKGRYLQSVLKNGRTWRDYFNADSPLRRRLSRFASEEYMHLLAGAAWRRFRVMQRERVERKLLSLNHAFHR